MASITSITSFEVTRYLQCYIWHGQDPAHDEKSLGRFAVVRLSLTSLCVRDLAFDSRSETVQHWSDGTSLSLSTLNMMPFCVRRGSDHLVLAWHLRSLLCSSLYKRTTDRFSQDESVLDSL